MDRPRGQNALIKHLNIFVLIWGPWDGTSRPGTVLDLRSPGSNLVYFDRPSTFDISNNNFSFVVDSSTTSFERVC